MHRSRRHTPPFVPPRSLAALVIASPLALSCGGAQPRTLPDATASQQGGTGAGGGAGGATDARAPNLTVTDARGAGGSGAVTGTGGAGSTGSGGATSSGSGGATGGGGAPGAGGATTAPPAGAGTSPVAYAKPGQVIVHPGTRAWLAYNRDSDGDNRLDPAICIGPGAPEGFLYGGFTAGWTQERIIDFLAQNGGNCIYVAVVMAGGGGVPWSGSNTATLDEAKMVKWDGWLAAMGKAGITTFLFIYDDTVKPVGTPFVRALVKRLKHHTHLVWVIAEEWTEAHTRQEVLDAAAAIRAEDEFRHPIGVHQHNGVTFDFPGQLDHFPFQSTAGSLAEVRALTVQAWKNAAGRYSINSAELHYTDIATATVDKTRPTIWATALAGASFMQLGPWETNKNRRPLDVETAKAYGYAHRYLEAIGDLPEMAPADELVKSGSAWALGRKGHYIAYLPMGGNASLDLAGATGKLAVEWYSPSTGERRAAADVDGGGTVSLAAPGAGDWVVQVGKAGKAAPGSANPSPPNPSQPTPGAGGAGSASPDAGASSGAGGAGGSLQARIAGGDRNVTYKQSATFDGRMSTGRITKYTWDFDDGTPFQSGAMVTHAFESNGPKDVVLTVEDAAGNKSQAMIVVTVVGGP